MPQLSNCVFELVDGSQFEFDLNPIFGEVDDSFSLDSNLTITLVATVPEPGCGLALTAMSILLLGRRRKKALRS